MCRNLAEAGIDKAIAELRLNPKYEGEKDSTLALALPGTALDRKRATPENGLFSVEVKPGVSAGTWEITSTGSRRYKGFTLTQATVAATVAMDAAGKVSRFEWREVRGRLHPRIEGSK